jgi:hypothetical protein
MKTVIFLPAIYRHERLEELSARLKLTVGGTTDFQVAQSIDDLPVGSTVAIDSLYRLGDTADRVASTLVKILEHSEVLIPNGIDLRRSNSDFDSLVQLITLLANVKRQIKSARIRESLYIKSQLNGGLTHDSGITPELKKMVIEEFQRCNAVRQTSRRLKEIGFSVSPSSVSRIIKAENNE